MSPKDYSDQTCEIPEIAPQVLPLPVSLHHHTAPRTVQRTQAGHFHTALMLPPLVDVHSNDPDHPPIRVTPVLMPWIGLGSLPQLQCSSFLNKSPPDATKTSVLSKNSSSLLPSTPHVLANQLELGEPSLQPTWSLLGITDFLRHTTKEVLLSHCDKVVHPPGRAGDYSCIFINAH